MFSRVSLLITVAQIGNGYADNCTQLCNFDGFEVCTKGSWTEKGVCQHYRYFGLPDDGVYCYHTVLTQAQCPASGDPVKPEDVDHLMSLARARRNISALSGGSTASTQASARASAPQTFSEHVETSATGSRTDLNPSTPIRAVVRASRFGK